MSNSSLITVASFSFPHEAQLARANLESAGVPAFVADEHTINMQWLYSHAMGGVKVQVPAVFVQQAREILEADFSDSLSDLEIPEPVKCPKCGSENCRIGSSNRVPAFLAFFLLNIPLFFTKQGILCEDCGEFTRKSDSASGSDL